MTEGKWYNQILNQVKSFFNMDTSAQESEIHEKMTEFGSYEQMEAKIRSDVEAEFKAKQGGDDDEFYKALSDERDDLVNKLKVVSDEATQLKKSAKVLADEVAQLKLDATAAADRIIELEKGPAAPIITGPTDPPGQPKSNTPVWDAYKKRFEKA